MTYTEDFLKRFWEKVQKTDGCWNWIGAKAGKGYGYIRVPSEGTNRYAHRIIWDFCISAIPKGRCICHHCDNPSCVNPSHLFLGTHEDNERDKIDKDRTKIKMKTVNQIKNTEGTDLSVAKIFGVAKGTVWNIRQGLGSMPMYLMRLDDRLYITKYPFGGITLGEFDTEQKALIAMLLQLTDDIDDTMSLIEKWRHQQTLTTRAIQNMYQA